ncbi:unnamed protein product, partial [Ectocarpus sp. 12 AP-2014]
ETKYQKLSSREHILRRPDMYTGSTDAALSANTIIEADGKLVEKQFATVPAFLQCFEEILMNAADRVSAAHESGSTVVCRTKTIMVEVSRTEISVFNDGDSISPVMLDEFQVYAPELIFGHLRSSSNYDDSKARITSGKNGFGAKICNVFSSSFTVETACAKTGILYRQTFEKNMSVINPPVLTKFSRGSKPYTIIRYVPDFARLNMGDTRINGDIQGILRRRCYEISATSMDAIRVWFNGTRVPVTKIDHYAALYAPDAGSRFSAEVNERWKISVGVLPSRGHRTISFCNGTATLDGGKHVDYIVDPLVRRLLEYLRKKFKAPAIKPGVIRDCLTVVVSAFIENPVYSSQCKNYLSSAPGKFGSSCSVPEHLFGKIVRSGLTAAVESHLKSKEKRVLNATDGRKSSKIRGVAKLHDAAKAGTRDSSKCFLFLCEGDSALTMLLSRLKSSPRDHCGCFPLKGKLLNIRDASASQVAANTEIANLKKILGLQQGKTYEESRKELRYGKVVLLCDADSDGAHIAGLLLNVFNCFWPGLIDAGFIGSMATPIVRATGPRGEVKLFYTEFDHSEWLKKNSSGERAKFKQKFLKGLGSSSAKEAKEYFENFSKSLVRFTRDEGSSNAMTLAFPKDRANDRKAWLSSYDKSEILDPKQAEVSPSEFVHLGLKHFSESDVRRSIPSAIDGLKTSQRKILFGCFLKSELKSSEMKVAQLCGYIADKSHYHHGEVSLSSAITSMAQDFVGSNNINLLLPRGQLGSRLQGGKDAASPRYTFVQLSPLTSLIYRREDAPILEYTHDDGVQTEPVHYVPIIPMSLVNRCEGIGSGFSTSVPAYNPLDLVQNVKRRLASSEVSSLQPWYRGFGGSIHQAAGGNFRTVGVFEVKDARVVRITDLPVGTWTSSYKVFLDGLVDKKVVASYAERCTDVAVDITVQLLADASYDDVAALLKLSSTLRTSNMHLYSAADRIVKYSTVAEIEEEHFRARFQAYVLRKKHMLRVLEHELQILRSKARFIESKLSGGVVIDNVPFDRAMLALEKAGFPKLGKTFDDSGEKTYSYATSLNMFDVTSERVAKLRKEVELKSLKLVCIKETSVSEMWVTELDELSATIGELFFTSK